MDGVVKFWSVLLGVLLLIVLVALTNGPLSILVGFFIWLAFMIFFSVAASEIRWK